MPELTQTVSPLGSSSSAVPQGGIASRGIIDQTVSTGEKTFAAGSSKPLIEQTIHHSERGGMRLSESTRKMLANLDAHGTVADKPDSSQAAPASDAAGAQAAPTPASQSHVDTTGAAAATPAAPKPEPAPDEHRVRADRFEARNRELVGELERLKSAPKGELDKRLKALDAAERAYLDDPIGSIRQLIATVHGIDDPKHADIDAELSGLYQDLTARELGVPVDSGKQAVRESLRTKQMLARERREREAAAQRPSPEPNPEAERDAQHTQLIAGRLADKTVADQFPLTVKFAERLHGAKPEALILRVIRDGFSTGEFDPKDQDHKLIEQAARKIETHYQDLAKSFDEARPRTSTAPPTPQADAKATQEQGRSQVAPTITNASASVAPATPPAKPAPAADDDFKRRRPGETEDARRRRIAQRYLRD